MVPETLTFSSMQNPSALVEGKKKRSLCLSSLAFVKPRRCRDRVFTVYYFGRMCWTDQCIWRSVCRDLVLMFSLRCFTGFKSVVWCAVQVMPVWCGFGSFFHQIWWSGFRWFDGGLSSLFLHVLSLTVCPLLFLLVLVSFVFGCLHLRLRPKHPDMSLALHQGVLLLAQFSVVMFTVEEIRGRWRIQFKVLGFSLRFVWRPSVRLFLWVIYEAQNQPTFYRSLFFVVQWR